MAFAHHVITALLFALALSKIDLSVCQLVKGKVSCTDCTQNYDFSGIKVSVKCEGEKNLGVATTEDDGSFKVDLPSSGHAKPPHDVNCLVKLLGGPNPLYASRKNLVTQIVKGENSYTYTISTPLSFFTSCPQNTQCNKELGSSKTIDLPVPPEWGLAPTSYYLPFFPIIGIP